jgi:hypothetical protein
MHSYSGHRDRPCRAGLRAQEPTPSPRNDIRGPVEDSYDITAAIKEFQKEYPIDKQQAMCMSLTQLHRQAEQLKAPSGNEYIPLHVRAHYTCVREKMLEQARFLEEQLLEEVKLQDDQSQLR